MKERKPVTREFAVRYRAAGTKAEKPCILSGFVPATGCSRKYAIGIPGSEGTAKLLRLNGELAKARITRNTGKKRAYEKQYGPDAAVCVIRLREFFKGMCGKRLVPLIRANIATLAKDPRFGITQEIRGKLGKISRSTVERILKGERKKRRLKGTSATKPGSLLKHQIPVKVFWPWDEQRAGFCEIDTVSHDGGNASGEYCFTLTVTDIATQRAEDRALKTKAHHWVREALDEVYASFPVPLKGIDSDNGSEFINTAMKTWCEQREITFTRTRSYHKNDNCYREQKNGDVVRKTVGYARYTSEGALAAVYQWLNPLLNYFYPCTKLVDKIRKDSGKTRKVYGQPATPYERLLARDDVPEEAKERLKAHRKRLNIIRLQDALDEAVDQLLLSAQRY
jgi:transposase InsO family protein